MKLKLLTENKSFRFLWVGQLISALGDRLTQMGILTFIMVASGDDGSKMALVTFFSLLPSLLFGPLFGVLVDRYSRKKIMLVADFLRAVLVILIPIIWINTHQVGLVIVLVFLLGSLTALFTPAKMSIITNIVTKEDILEANSLIVTTGLLATLLGTLIAAVIIKLTGVKVGFYINSLTYIISALFILNIIYKKTQTKIKVVSNIYETFIEDIKVGLRYALCHRLIMRLIMLSSIFAFISSFAYILILNYSAIVLREGPLGIGVLLSIAGLGMVIGALILLKRKERVNYNRALYLPYFIIGASCFAFIFHPPLYACLAILFCAGIGISVLTIALDTILQRVSPDELKGKIFASRGIFTSAVFLVSLLLVGLLIKIISVGILFGLIGIVGLITSLGVFLSDKLWGYQLVRMFFGFLMRVLFNFKVSGLENIPKYRKVILAGNHTSVIDGVAVMCAYPGRVYFLAAESLFKMKFFGWCAKKLGYIPVKRGGFNKDAIEEALHILKAGYSIGIFPEGKITQDGRITEGKAGVAVIAELADADIIPLAIEGAYEAWPLPNKYPRLFPIEVRFGAPIDIKGHPAPKELVNEIMQDIAKLKLSLEREGYLRVDSDEIIKRLINVG